MLESLPQGLLNDLTGPAALVLVAMLVITRRLVWHTDLTKAEKRADRWEGIALDALSAAEKLTVHAEVTNEVLTKIPTPPRPQAATSGEAGP